MSEDLDRPMICQGSFTNHRWAGGNGCLRCGKRQPLNRDSSLPRQKLINGVHLTAKSDPLAAGYDARIAGLTVRACPFKSSAEEECKLWLQGWKDADFELSRGSRAELLSVSRR